MAAVLGIKKCTGTNAATETTQTSNITRLLSQDNASVTVGLHEVGVPISGTGYSYESHIRWFIDGTAPANRIENIRTYYPESVPSSGITIYAGTTATGTTPVNIVSTIAVDQVDSGGNAHNSEANALAIGTPQTDDELVVNGDKTDYVVVQIRVTTSALGGNFEFTSWLLYDEV